MTKTMLELSAVVALTAIIILLTTAATMQQTPADTVPTFEPVIVAAFDDLLQRSPLPTEIDNYDQLMQSGMTEAQMRESIVRSDEYATANPLPFPMPAPPLTPAGYVTIAFAIDKGNGIPGTGLIDDETGIIDGGALGYLRDNNTAQLIRDFEAVIHMGCDTTGPLFDITAVELNDLTQVGSLLHWGQPSEDDADRYGIRHPSFVTFYGTDNTATTGLLSTPNARCTLPPDGDFCDRTAAIVVEVFAWHVDWFNWRTTAERLDNAAARGILDFCKQTVAPSK